MHRPTRVRAVLGLLAFIVFPLAGCGGKTPTQPPPIASSGELRLSCPQESVVDATSPAGAQVHFDVPSPTGGLAPVTVECTPGSGALFAVGETAVRCTATGSDRAQSSCGFTVRVRISQTVSRTKFVAFGDSITEGAVSLAPLLMLGPPDTYPYKLEQMLLQRYASQTILVTNHGLGGERTTHGVNRLPSVIAAEKPQVLLLLEGINQINELSTDAQANALESMIDHARRAGVETIVATVMPVTPAWTRYRATTLAKIRSLNDRIGELADEYRIGDPVDLFAIFEANIGLIGADGLHPTPEGQTRIAEAFRDEIVRRYGNRTTMTQRFSPTSTTAVSPRRENAWPASTASR